MWVCAPECNCQQEPEEGIRSTDLEDQEVVSPQCGEPISGLLSE